MKKILTIFFTTLLLTNFLTAQKEVNISGTLSNCNYEKIYFFDHEGVILRALGEIPVTIDENNVGRFSFKTSPIPKGFYFVGSNDRNFKIMLLGEENAVQVEGNAPSLQQAKVLNSPQNEAYAAMMWEIQKLQESYQKLLRQYPKAINNPAKLSELNAKMKVIDEKKVAYLNSLKKSNPYLHKIAALQTYLSYQTYKKAGQIEADYFATTYFDRVNFQDASYQLAPHVLDAFKSYAYTLGSVNLTNEQQQGYIAKIFEKIPTKTKTHKMALAGLMLGYFTKNNTNFVHYGKQFIEKYGADNSQVTQYFKTQISQLEAFSVGKVAPEITQSNPKGEQQSLSDLRGKVVLVDFWASWCRPCRKENPRVKALYSKYKDLGFDIYAVSLDKTKGSWLKAIETDGLPWHHVSDLKGWQNEAALRYGVSSIPQTVLLDEEGKIIARNLRGEPLERKLEQIFAGKAKGR